jgi:hypothetical protein
VAAAEAAGNPPPPPSPPLPGRPRRDPPSRYNINAFYGCVSLVNATFMGQMYSVISYVRENDGYIIVDLPKEFYDAVNRR